MVISLRYTQTWVRRSEESSWGLRFSGEAPQPYHRLEPYLVQIRRPKDDVCGGDGGHTHKSLDLRL